MVEDLIKGHGDGDRTVWQSATVGAPYSVAVGSEVQPTEFRVLRCVVLLLSAFANGDQRATELGRKLYEKVGLRAVTMGNQVARGSGTGSQKKANAVGSTGNDLTTKKAMSRSASGADIEHTSHTQFLPIDKLAKILGELSLQEESVNGVTENVFRRYIFPQYPSFADKLFAFLHRQSKATVGHLGISAFKQQTERFLSLMNDQTILESYVKMYAKECADITPEGLKDLLMVTYQLALDSATGKQQHCTQIHRTIDAVTTSCFHGKEVLSVSYVSNWLWQHCPRLLNGLHRYVVHVFTTAYRNGPALLSEVQSQPHLEPATPVLEQSVQLDGPKPLLPLSHVWLLSGSLPPCYTQTVASPTDGTQALIAKMAGATYPSHWTLLYNSGQHGSGANRFIHHVLGYKGPTLLFLRGVSPEEGGEQPTYCICSAVEWCETHQYWGDEDSMVIELLPNFRIVEKGPKLVYLNTIIRGYPQGVRAGSDPRNPCVDLDKSFQWLKLAGVPYRLDSLEVWGCGDRKSREVQLEIKKWQVKEAERQRVVKMSTSDWLDHPDRYLLELGGRTTYNNAEDETLSSVVPSLREQEGLQWIIINEWKVAEPFIVAICNSLAAMVRVG